MKHANDGGAMRNANEGKNQQRSNLNPQMRDPRERQWGTANHQNRTQPMSHAPQRDMSGKRKDVND
jgi:hypothetical protein